jgi:hypothetical protein
MAASPTADEDRALIAARVPQADEVLGRDSSEPERLTREVLSVRHAFFQHHPNAKPTIVNLFNRAQTPN